MNRTPNVWVALTVAFVLICGAYVLIAYLLLR
jgi:hypothetical protein